MANSNAAIAEQVFQEQYGIGVKELTDFSVEEVVRKKADEYVMQDEMRRSMTYISTVTEYETFKRTTLSFFTGEYASIIKTLSMVDGIPSAYRRETMRFFNKDFPGFDAGAAKAVGTFLKNGIARVKQDAGAIDEKGKASHLKAYIMQGIIERSRAKFFVALRKDYMGISKFERKLDTYCGMVWSMCMVEEGTYTNDMPISERIRNRNEYAKAQVEDFLSTEYKVQRDSRIKSDELYGDYEQWAEGAGQDMLGRGSFIEALTGLLPNVSQLRIGSHAYVKGIRKAS